MNIHKNV